MAYGPQFYKMAEGQYYGGDGRDMILRLGTTKTMEGRDAVLLLYSGSTTAGRWTQYNLHDGDNSIGRAEGCDIRINNVAISRLHAGVRCINGEYYVFDNKSTNGVFVNGIRISKPVKLSNKDIFTILNTTFIYSGNQLFYKVNPEGIALNIRGLNKVVSSKKGKKTILDKVSLGIGANEFVAIIGGSGAGKTTLMTAMSGFDTDVTGEVLCNGINLRENFQTLKNVIGFVPQQDIIYENLTLKKMLYYTAKLKMPEDTSKAEINARIKDVLEMVELQDHMDTYIRRLSGGQKKRASIAVELLANPGLFFLDEPTSGLDPGTEEHLMLTLSRLSKEQEKTVVMVTHTTNNLHLCDKVIIMGYGGKLCYCGAPSGIKDFFQTDNIVRVYDMITADTAGWEARFRMSGINKVDDTEVSSEKEIKPKKVSNFNQLSVLIRRYVTLIKNDVQRLLMIFGQPILIGLLLSLVAKDDIYEVMVDTRSIMFTLMSAGIWMGLFNTIQEIYKERVILKREYMANLKLPVYMLSKYVVQAVIAILQAVIIVAVFVLMKGKPECSGVVFENATLEIVVTMFVTIYVSASFGLLISSVAKNGDRAMAVAPFILIIQLIFSGILFELTGATDKISYFTFSRWSMEALGSTTDLNDLQQLTAEAQQEADEAEEKAEQKRQDLIDSCNESIADMQTEYAETINELQDQIEELSALTGQPQTFDEFVPEEVDVTPEDEDDEEEESEEEDKMYIRTDSHMYKCWGLLFGETFLFAGVSILVLRKLKDEQR
jgi:ABC-type multidrug transport system ATPase subunit